MPNTRYIVNIYNSEGNMKADISVAKWENGTVVETDDLILKLNASATLAGVDTKSTLSSRLLTVNYNTNNGDNIATITGSTSDTKPILITAPEWITIGDAVTSTGTAVYTLALNWRASGNRPYSGVITTTTVDHGQKVIKEYQVFKDHTDVTTLTGGFPRIGTFEYAMETVEDADGDLVYVKLPAFGIDMAGMIESNFDFLMGDIPWLKRLDIEVAGENATIIGITNNLNQPERSVVVKMRRYDGDNSTLVTKSLKVVQAGTYTNEQLSATANISLSQAFLDKGYIKAEEIDGVYTITVAGMELVGELMLEPIFTVNGEEFDNDSPKFVAVESNSVEFFAEGVLVPTTQSYQVKVQYPLSYTNTYEQTIDFTITTYKNGGRDVKKCRLIRKVYGING